MVDLFESKNYAAVIQMDSINAFNSLNSNVCLHNIKIIYPEISNFVINCYTLPSRCFFVKEKEELKSNKRTTRGGPIAMGLYTLGITPLMAGNTSPSDSIHHSSS